MQYLNFHGYCGIVCIIKILGEISKIIFFLYRPHKYNREKWKKYEIRFTGKTTFTTLFPRDFQTLNARAARAALLQMFISFAYQNLTKREAAVKQILFFLEILMLYDFLICYV